MPPRKLLIVVPSLRAGGAERVMCTLLRHFDRERFHITLTVLDGSEVAFWDDLPPDVEIYKLHYSRVRHALLPLVRLIWRARPDVILSTTLQLNVALGIVRRLMPRNCRLVVRETTILGEMYRARPEFWWLKLLYSRIHLNFDRIICQSIAMRDDLILNQGVNASRIQVINNPIDVRRVVALAKKRPDRYLRDRAGIHFVAVGRLVPEKGFDLLIDAIASLRQPDVHVEIIGAGPLEGQLLRQVRTLGLESRIVFRGFQSNPYEFMALADALILSSRYEGFPNVALEALACGTPVIATPAVGGVREMLDEISHCVVAASITAASLCEAIRTWLAKAPQRVPATATSRYEAAQIAKTYEETLLSV